MPRRVSGDLPQEVNLAPAYPGYFLVRRKYIQNIRADPRDTCRRTFSAEFEIRRELRSRRRHWRRFDDRPVMPKPARNKFGRWQLEVRFCVNGRTVRTPYHRVVGLTTMVCTKDHLGFECEPFQVFLGGLTQGLYDTFWEVDHGDKNTRNNNVSNLNVLWWEYHRSLQR